MPLHRPTNNHPGVEVEHDCKIQSAFSGRNVSEVSHPLLIRRTGFKLSFNDEHTFSEVLAQLTPHAHAGEVKAHRKVLDELKRRWKPIHKEVKKLPDSGIQVKSAVEMAPAVVSLAGVLLYPYPFLGRALSPQNEADPWIIATAEINRWTVVTDEGSGRRPSRSVLGVCNKRDVPCLNRHQFASALNVTL